MARLILSNARILTLASPTPGPPCFSAAGAGHTSGAAQALPGAVETVYAREFEPL